MPRNANRRRRRLAVEALEERCTPSGVANTLALVAGDVAAPRAVAQVTANIPASNLVPGRKATIFAISVQPGPNSALLPQVVSATGPGGQPLPVQAGALVRSYPFAGPPTFYVYDSASGPVTF